MLYTGKILRVARLRIKLMWFKKRIGFLEQDLAVMFMKHQTACQKIKTLHDEVKAVRAVNAGLVKRVKELEEQQRWIPVEVPNKVINCSDEIDSSVKQSYTLYRGSWCKDNDDKPLYNSTLFMRTEPTETDHE